MRWLRVAPRRGYSTGGLLPFGRGPRGRAPQQACWRAGCPVAGCSRSYNTQLVRRSAYAPPLCGSEVNLRINRHAILICSIPPAERCRARARTMQAASRPALLAPPIRAAPGAFLDARAETGRAIGRRKSCARSLWRCIPRCSAANLMRASRPGTSPGQAGGFSVFPRRAWALTGRSDSEGRSRPKRRKLPALRQNSSDRRAATSG